MSAITSLVDDHARLIAAVLGSVILFFLVACVANDAIPICHWLFQCDHRVH